MFATQLGKKCSLDLLGEPLGYAMLPKRLCSKNHTSGSGGGGAGEQKGKNSGNILRAQTFSFRHWEKLLPTCISLLWQKSSIFGEDCIF